MDFNQWLQSRLTSHGYPTGGIDGVIGKTTLAALAAFQKARGLPVTGKADAATEAALRSTSTQAGPPLIERMEAEAATSNRSVWPRQSEVTAFYGQVGTNQTSITPPWTMRLAWDKRRTIQRMTLHKKVAASALRAMTHAYAHYGDTGIKHLGLDLFGGSLNVRRMRGGSAYSMHSWGIAIDWDPERNQLRWKKPQARLSHDDCVPWWEAWEAEGWTSLGRARNFDWMHVQAASL